MQAAQFFEARTPVDASPVTRWLLELLGVLGSRKGYLPVRRAVRSTFRNARAQGSGQNRNCAGSRPMH
jgi:hypothetical protein